jgi:hypothetical protein
MVLNIAKVDDGVEMDSDWNFPSPEANSVDNVASSNAEVVS